MTKEEQNELKQGFEKIIEILAAAISIIIRSIKDKKQRLEAIKKLNPPIDHIKKVYEVALKNEDYETCEVIQELLNEI